MISDREDLLQFMIMTRARRDSRLCVSAVTSSQDSDVMVCFLHRALLEGYIRPDSSPIHPNMQCSVFFLFSRHAGCNDYSSVLCLFFNCMDSERDRLLPGK